ncbi:MAG: site-specific integrase [Pirellulaceae bacterium]
MPTPKRVPKYQRHKGRNLARVTINGKDHYLGRYDSPESYSEYERLIAEWLLQDVVVPDEKDKLTMLELMAGYLNYAHGYYVKRGTPTREFELIAEVFRPLRKLYGHVLAVEFGPRALKCVRQTLIEKGLSRKHINKQVGRIVRAFKHAASEEWIPVETYQALRTVEGLKKGRSAAPEHPPIKPVSQAHVDAVLRRARPMLRAMIQLQLYTGCRPSEALMMRPMDICQKNAIWRYQPESHKTEHHDMRRVIFIGPKAQEVIAPYLVRPRDAYCFPPREAEEQRRQVAHAQRRTPLNQGNTPKEGRSKQIFTKHYSVGAYRTAIRRICDNIGIPRWSPNQLRHSAATEIRRDFGLDAAQVVLGHASAATTEIYADTNEQLAAKVAGERG